MAQFVPFSDLLWKNALGLVLAYFYPITQAYHIEILLKLQERKIAAEQN